MIANSITASRWKQLKSVFKLNHNMMAPKKGMEGYDPSSNYDYSFLVLSHTMNYVTRYVDLDDAINGSTWGFSGFCGVVGWR